MSRLKQLASDTLIYGIGAVLPRIVSFLVVGSFLTYQLARDTYGIHGILYAYITFISVFFTLRMETTFFKFASDPKYKESTVYNTALTLVLSSSIILTSIILIGHKTWSSIILEPEHFRFILYFGLILFLDAIVAVPYAKLRQDNRPIKFSTIKIVNSLIIAGLNVFLYRFLEHFGPLSSWYQAEYLLDYTFIANLIGSFCVVLMLQKELRHFRWNFDWNLIGKMLRFAWPLIIVMLAGAINQFSDRVLIEYFTESFSDSGSYTGATKIAVIMSLFVTAFNYAAEPFFFKQASTASRKELYGKVALTFTICGGAIYLFVLTFLDIFKHIINVRYHDMLFIIPVALLANLMLGLYYNVSIWYKLSGKTIYGAIIAAVGSLVFLISAFVLIPRIGVIGANWASLVCFSMMVVLAYLIGKNKFPIYYPVKWIIFYLCLAVGIYALIDYLPWTGVNKILLGIAGMIIYAALAYFMSLRSILTTAK